MRISYSQLKECIDMPSSVEEVVSELVRTGTEVESLEYKGSQFDGVVTAKVLSKEPHPDSDHMWVTMVDLGEEEPLQIVCGAQNFKEGDHIVTAKIGAVLPGDIKIKKSKLRGVLSCGMNCSARELGLSDEHEGIMILPQDSPIGMPFAEYAELSDVILKLEITPNRPDCLSLEGIARELGAIFNKTYTYRYPKELEGFDPQTLLAQADQGNQQDKPLHELVSLQIEDEKRLERYGLRLIKNLKKLDTPLWLKKRLEDFGCRSVNAVVDITNYCMFVFGQPLHAFDYDTLYKDSEGKLTLSVRPARDHERIETLDGVERILHSDMTLIADEEQPLALAGVMGAKHSEVTQRTTAVLLESAVFSSSHSSRTSRNLQLFTEASMRFERGVDPEQCRRVLDIAAAMIVYVCEGELTSGALEYYPKPQEIRTLCLDTERMRSFIGAPISDEEAVSYLSSLGCTLQFRAEHSYQVELPSFRPDLQREVDLYEEVIRLWGMQRVPSRIPAARGHWGGLTQIQKLERKISRVLRALSINETITYSLVSPQDLDLLQLSEEGRGVAVELINPMNEEQSVMRRSLLGGMLRNLAYNQSHGVKNVQLFEQGAVFYGQKGQQKPREKQLVSIVMAGSYTPASWNEQFYELGFYDIKGVVETLARELCIEKLRVLAYEDEHNSCLQPGRAAALYSGGSYLGFFGELHPVVAKNFGIQGSVALCELDQEALIRCAKQQRAYQDIPRFPAVELDCSVLVDEEVSYEHLVQSIRSAGVKILEKVHLFDVYRDEQKLGFGKKSLAFSLTYRAEDKTLSSEEVDKAHQKILKKLEQRYGAKQREE